MKIEMREALIATDSFLFLGILCPPTAKYNIVAGFQCSKDYGVETSIKLTSCAKVVLGSILN